MFGGTEPRRLSALPSRLNVLMGNNEQIVEVQVPPADSGKRSRGLEPCVLDSSEEPTLVGGDALDGV